MKLCDLTQFYSPVSGGVKRYISEKVRYLREHTTADEHILIIPGERDACEAGERSRVYTIASPLISRTSRYRALLRLEAIERILERERPHLIESGDPYQVAWKAVHSGRALQIPVVGFYHSHFPEAYLRSARKFLGRGCTEFLLDASRRYIRCLYNSFARTLVPSPALGALLAEWGVANVVPTDLGVDTTHFTDTPMAGESLRDGFAIPATAPLLLYVGRLAFEKNTQTLFAAFPLVARALPEAQLIIIGDGLQRPELERLRSAQPGRVTWIPYCAEAARLAQFYRAADLFVHPGVQETFGLVTLEAQACGTPVVGIRGSYMDRIIHAGHDAWACENTPAALAEAICRALARPSEVGAAELSRRIVTQYSWTEVFHRLFALYRQVRAEYRPA